MSRLPRLCMPLILAPPLLFAGCGGPTAESDLQDAAATVRDLAAPAGDEGKATSAGPDSAPAKLVTPNRAVDPQQLVDTVKEEVKGGEATEGPTPKNYLWLPTAGKTQDEALTVEVPLGLNQLIPVAVVPAYNPMTKAKYELGKQLYFDPRVSKDGTVSCATCHNPEKGWTDQLVHSVGIDGQVGSRNAPTVLNTAYGKTMFWDGRAPSLEGQAQGPIQNKIEMGDQSYQEIIERLRQISGYQEQFQKVFGTQVTLDGMAKAIATFERTALSGNSPYDRYNSNNEVEALTDSQKRGMVLFGLGLNSQDDFKTDVVKKKANCTSCHIGFNFTDEKFHNLGVGYDEKAGKFGDLGRWAISPIGAKDDSEIGAFKTPTLRDIERTAPFMHDGTEKTLEEVVEYYDRGGNANPYLDKDMKKLNLTAQEKADVVAFMKALTGEEIKVALPDLPPGPDRTKPDPRDALGAPPAKTAQAVLLHPSRIR
jgi:cytochrome c peroxidase